MLGPVILWAWICCRVLHKHKGNTLQLCLEHPKAIEPLCEGWERAEQVHWMAWCLSSPALFWAHVESCHKTNNAVWTPIALYDCKVNLSYGATYPFTPLLSCFCTYNTLYDRLMLMGFIESCSEQFLNEYNEWLLHENRKLRLSLPK